MRSSCLALLVGLLITDSLAIKSIKLSIIFSKCGEKTGKPGSNLLLDNVRIFEADPENNNLISSVNDYHGRIKLADRVLDQGDDKEAYVTVLEELGDLDFDKVTHILFYFRVKDLSGHPPIEFYATNTANKDSKIKNFNIKESTKEVNMMKDHKAFAGVPLKKVEETFHYDPMNIGTIRLEFDDDSGQQQNYRYPGYCSAWSTYKQDKEMHNHNLDGILMGLMNEPQMENKNTKSTDNWIGTTFHKAISSYMSVSMTAAGDDRCQCERPENWVYTNTLLLLDIKENTLQRLQHEPTTHLEYATRAQLYNHEFLSEHRLYEERKGPAAKP